MTPRLKLVLFGVLCAAQLAVCAGLIYRWERILRTGAPFKFITQPVDPFDAFRGRYVAINLEQNFFESSNPGESRHYTSGQRVYAILSTDVDGYARFDQLHSARPAQEIPYLKVTVSHVDENFGFLAHDILNAPALARMMLTSNDAVSVAIREKLENYEREKLEECLADDAAAAALVDAVMSPLNRRLHDQDFADRLFGKGKLKDLYRNQPLMRQKLVQAYPEYLAPAPAVRVFLNIPFDRFYMEETQAPRAESAYREHSRRQSAERTCITVRIRKGVGVIENLWIGDETIGDYLSRSVAD